VIGTISPNMVIVIVIVIERPRKGSAIQTVSNIYAIQDQKKDPPIIPVWNPDLSHTDTLHEGRFIHTSTRTKKTPSTKSDDFLR
jgi:hypothetical protein